MVFGLPGAAVVASGFSMRRSCLAGLAYRKSLVRNLHRTIARGSLIWRGVKAAA